MKELPFETQQSTLQERVSKEFPTLSGDRFLLVDTQTTRLAIDDISYRSRTPVKDDIETLALSCKGWTDIYDARTLIPTLAQKMRKLLDIINARRTLIVFPGNGARVVKDLLPQDLLDDVNNLELPTQRRVEASGAVAEVTVSDMTRARKMAAEIKMQNLIVLDDAIVTGTTLTAIREIFPARTVMAFAGSLFTLSPLQRKNKPTNIEGIKSIFTSIIYQGTTGIPPLNSLSTIIGNSERSAAIRAKYIGDYVEDKETFLETIKRLQTKEIL
ncbi:hypothetical protein HYU92_03480 [Candidatus Curtissbacteria bacterium]|nr:hypothetical protein [Candidatus Curtissbacteria bacterium]